MLTLCYLPVGFVLAKPALRRSKGARTNSTNLCPPRITDYRMACPCIYLMLYSGNAANRNYMMSRVSSCVSRSPPTQLRPNSWCAIRLTRTSHQSQAEIHPLSFIPTTEANLSTFFLHQRDILHGWILPNFPGFRPYRVHLLCKTEEAIEDTAPYFFVYPVIPNPLIRRLPVSPTTMSISLLFSCRNTDGHRAIICS